MKRACILLLSIFISSLCFAQNHVQDPYTIVAGKSRQVCQAKGLTATTAELLANPFVTIGMPGFTLVSYAFSIKPKHGDYIGPFVGHTSEFTVEMKDAIKSIAGRGGKIMIEEVKVMDNSNQHRAHLNSVVLDCTN